MKYLRIKLSLLGNQWAATDGQDFPESRGGHFPGWPHGGTSGGVRLGCSSLWEIRGWRWVMGGLQQGPVSWEESKSGVCNVASGAAQTFFFFLKIIRFP